MLFRRCPTRFAALPVLEFIAHPDLFPLCARRRGFAELDPIVCGRGLAPEHKQLLNKRGIGYLPA
jgi:hypothetical protein